MSPPDIEDLMSCNIPIHEKVQYLTRILSTVPEITPDFSRKLAANIKQWIKTSTTRYAALQLWNICIDTLGLYIAQWQKLLITSLKLATVSSINNHPSSKKLEFIIMNKIVIKFGKTTKCEAHLEMSIKDTLKYLLEECSNNEDLVLHFNFLSTIMQYVPQVLGHHTVEIQKFILSHLYNPSDKVKEALSTCFAKLPKSLMFVNAKHVAYASTWETLFMTTLNSLKFHMNKLELSCKSSIGITPVDGEMLEIPCKEEKGLLAIDHCGTLISALSLCLAKLLCTESYKIRVPVEEVLNVAKRQITIKGNVQKQSCVALLFPQLCQSALLLLEAVIKKFNVTEHIHTIMKLLIVALKDQEGPSSRQIRYLIWQFMNIWIDQCGCTVSSQIISKELIAELLVDILAVEEVITIQELQGQTRISRRALKLLKSFVETAAIFFEKERFELFVSNILKEVEQVQLSMRRKSLFLYKDKDCRLQLYNLLLACCEVKHPVQNNCILRSVPLFQQALKDPNIEVISLSNRACSFFTCFLNPTKPTPLKTEENTKKKDPQNVVNSWQFPNAEWPQQAQNGQAPPVNNGMPGPEPLYLDLDNEVNEQQAREDSPVYMDSGPPSRSDSMDESEEDEIIPEEDDDEHQVNSRNKHNALTAQRSRRPNIQMLEPQRSVPRSNVAVVKESQAENDFMEEDEVAPVYSRDRIVHENGTGEESDDEDEEYDDNNDEEGEIEEEVPEYRLSPEAEGRITPEVEDKLSPEPDERSSHSVKRLSPQPEEMPIKKMKTNIPEMYKESSQASETEKQPSNEEEIEQAEVNGMMGAKLSEPQSPIPDVKAMLNDLVLKECED